MPRYRIQVEYDGRDFSGWQRQKHALSIQQSLEDALKIILREEVAVTGSGRTDAGVHARGQVAHFDLPETVDAHRLLASLNGVLPDTIAVPELVEADRDFHARYDAVRRVYHYYVSKSYFALDRGRRLRIPADIDVGLMNEAAEQLVGTHDFSSFCRTQSETENRICSISHAGWHDDRRTDDFYFRIDGNRFLHGMVRAFVGTLLEVGSAQRDAGSMRALLACKDRRKAGPAAPPFALVLEKVLYTNSSTE